MCYEKTIFNPYNSIIFFSSWTKKQSCWAPGKCNKRTTATNWTISGWLIGPKFARIGYLYIYRPNCLHLGQKPDSVQFGPLSLSLFSLITANHTLYLKKLLHICRHTEHPKDRCIWKNYDFAMDQPEDDVVHAWLGVHKS